MKSKFTLIISLLLIISLQSQQRNEQKFSLAQSFEQTGDYNSAVKLYEELYASDPANSEYINALYRTYTQLKNYAALVNILDERIKQRPEDIEAYGMLGSTYYLMGNEEKSIEVWNQPFKAGNVNPMFYRIIANYAVERRAFETAINFYERGKNADADKIVYAFDLARLYSLTMQFEKAAGEYCFILSVQPTHLKLVETRVFENINRPGALEAMIRVLENCADKKNLSFYILLARLYSEKKLYQKAYGIYINIEETQSSKGRELYNFARQMFAEKEYLLASEVFKSITERYPDSPLLLQAYLGYARSLEALLFEEYENSLPLWKPHFQMEKYQSQKTEDVVKAFNTVINLYKQSEAAYQSIFRIALIKFYLLLDYDDAKRLLEKIIKEAPFSENSAEAYLEIGNISTITGNLAEAEKNYLAVLSLLNSTEEQKNRASYKLGKINFYRGQFDEARKYLSRVLGNLKDNLANDAVEMMILLNPQINDSSNLVTYAKAALLSEQRKFHEAAASYKKLADNPQAFILQAFSAIKYGEMMLAVDNYQEAVLSLERVSLEGEKNIYADKAVYLLGKIHQFGIKNYVKAHEYYQKLLADFPRSIYADDARAQILLLQSKSGT